jgi:HNH endonuclease
MDAETREFVRKRAGQRCEYCHSPDHAHDLPFHVEHIIANVHRIDHFESNLAWACPRCNLHKGTNLSTIDAETGEVGGLFNPRNMTWQDHFEFQDGVIRGRTACGRGTVRLLDMNSEYRVQQRRQLISLGEFPQD